MVDFINSNGIPVGGDIRAGQPETRMLSGIINKWTYNDIRNLLKYAKSLPKENPQRGCFDRIKDMIGFGEKDFKSYAHEKHRSFGPKMDL